MYSYKLNLIDAQRIKKKLMASNRFPLFMIAYYKHVGRVTRTWRKMQKRKVHNSSIAVCQGRPVLIINKDKNKHLKLSDTIDLYGYLTESPIYSLSSFTQSGLIL